VLTKLVLHLLSN